MKSVMSHNFATVPQAQIPRSSFDRSHGYKTTMDAGYLVPVFMDEALPGDTFNVRATMFGRLATPIAPFMDNLFLDVFFFAVPMRLLWTNWERFNGAQDDPDDSTVYLCPVMQAPAVTGHAVGSLSDYLGIPTGIAGLQHTTFFHRAYNMIWNTWFRSEVLQDSVVVDTDDGPDTATDYVLLRRGKRFDYFTSCLPWPQKGTAVTLPLGTSAPVIGDGTTNWWIHTNTGDDYQPNVNSGVASVGLWQTPGASEAIYHGKVADLTKTGLKADLSTATSATINALREAFQIQRLYERDARGGTRYTEILRSHFGVISPDFRLQRPEYLGGGSSPINIHPIAQTSSTDATTPQGNLAAMGTVQHHGIGFTKSFTEHCVILGLASVRADLNYQQGLNRMFSRRSRFDFYWPALSHLGEQAVLNKEIYANNDANDSLVFGYNERYSEYRYKPSQITGKLRSTASGTLDVWHLAQKFNSLPVLNDSFIEDNPPISRVIAVDTEPHFILDCYYKMITARPMPVYSVPGLIDHF